MAPFVAYDDTSIVVIQHQHNIINIALLAQTLVSFKKYMPPPLPWNKEEEGAYIFWMKQVSVNGRHSNSPTSNLIFISFNI